VLRVSKEPAQAGMHRAIPRFWLGSSADLSGRKGTRGIGAMQIFTGLAMLPAQLVFGVVLW
jgi:hypothetical protein